MQITERMRKLLFQHEVLRAKLELKNHFLESVIREVYEHTGQVLSLARIRLATVEGRLNEHVQPDIIDAGNLIGEAISTLRKISKGLFPEQEILSDGGFIKTLKIELGINSPDSRKILQVFGTPSTLDQEPAVILLVIILDIIDSIKSIDLENSLHLKIEYTDTDILISIYYHGMPINLGASEDLNNSDISDNLNIQQRLKLIRGSIVTESGNRNRRIYQITVPYN